MKTCANRRMAPSDEHAKRRHLNSYDSTSLPWEGSNHSSLNRKDENETARRDGHIAFSARFGVRPCKSGRSRRSSDSVGPGSADNNHHAKRVAALPEGTSRILHWFRTRRSSVPGERSVTHVWILRHVRARCPLCMAYPSARPDPGRDGWHWPGTALGWADRGNTAGDVVWIPPGQKHWHGASPTTAMTHIAIQEEVGGKNVDWMEHVSDEQYGR
jgi:hypothetical protein